MAHPTSDPPRVGQFWARLPRVILFLIGLGLLCAAAIYHRSEWGLPLPGEATVLMQAESLAHDGDLEYTRGDYDRYILGRRHQPPDLLLRPLDTEGDGGEGDGTEVDGAGERLAFGQPLAYPLFVAPFLRAQGDHGFAMANALWVSLALWLGVWALGDRWGPLGPWWWIGALGASPLLVHAFLATDGVFLFGANLLAFAVLLGGRGDGESPLWRPAVCGGLLALTLLSHAPSGVLLVATAVALSAGAVSASSASGMKPTERRWRGPTALLVGLGLAVGVLVFTTARLGGGEPWGPTARFIVDTGYPGVDWPAADWAAMDEPNEVEGQASAGLIRWAAVDLLVGPTGGLILYFPALIPLVLAGLWRGQWMLIAAGMGWCLWMIFAEPYAQSGAGFAGNPRFLAIYGALCLAPVAAASMRTASIRKTARQGEATHRRSWMVALALGWATALGLTLWGLGPMLSSPWERPLESMDRPRAHPRGSEILGIETVPRRHGQRVVTDQGVDWWLLDDGLWFESKRAGLHVEGTGTLILASPRPLDSLALSVGSRVAAGPPTVDGDVDAVRVDGLRIELTLDRSPRVHAPWWTPDPRWLYRLTITAPPEAQGPLALRPEVVSREDHSQQ